VQCIADIRRALGDDSRQPRFVKTLPKLGYRFIGAVEPQWPAVPMTIETEEITSVEIEFTETDAIAPSFNQGGALQTQLRPPAGSPAKVARRRRVVWASAIGLSLLIALAGFVYPGKMFLQPAPSPNTSASCASTRITRSPITTWGKPTSRRASQKKRGLPTNNSCKPGRTPTPILLKSSLPEND
jgi:hypothetical protein